MRVYNGQCKCGAIRYEGTDAPNEDTRCIHCGTIPDCGQEQDSQDLSGASSASTKGCLLAIAVSLLFWAAGGLTVYGIYLICR